MKAPADIYEYLQAYKGYFYHWETDGDNMVVVANGRVVAYLPQLMELLSLMEESGAPAFGCLLLAMIATDVHAEEGLEAVRKNLHDAAVLLNQQFLMKTEDATDAFVFLDKLSSVAAAFRAGSKRKQLLFSIFQKSHNLIAGRHVRRYLREHSNAQFDPLRLVTRNKQSRDRYESPTEPNLLPLHLGILQAHLGPLTILNRRYPTIKSILNAIVDIPDVTELPLPTDQPSAVEGATPKDFVEALEWEEKTFHAGTLVRRIWSGLAIPFHTHLPSVQPLGGVSDLSNRGDLDKLLISEWANDETLFLSRLANGEALYINREPPPETDRLNRVVLIDSSLQTWGTPRSVAFALLIAIAHHPKTDMACTAFALGDGYTPLLFGNTTEVIDGLQMLSPTASAAAGLEAYLRDHAAPKLRQELIFITSAQGWREAPVQRAVHEQLHALTYCIAADDEGGVQVYKRRGASLGAMPPFKLPLQTLWAKPPTKKLPNLAKKRKSDIVPPPTTYPILFPTPANARAYWKIDDENIFAITPEGAVLHHKPFDVETMPTGWVYIRGDLPTGNCEYGIGRLANGNILLLCQSIDQKKVFLYNLNSGAHGYRSFDSYNNQGKSSAFTFLNEGFMFFKGNKYLKFSMSANRDTEDNAEEIRLELYDFVEWSEKIKEVKSRMIELGSHKEIPSTMLSGTILKKLTHVSVTPDGRLFINQFQLGTRYGAPVFEIAKDKEGGVYAWKDKEMKCTFKDQSSITLNKSGMLCLQSANPSIPDIYIPAVLDAQLGMTTESFYAGNDFYYAETPFPKERILVEDFNTRFIQPFIDHILHHAASA